MHKPMAVNVPQKMPPQQQQQPIYSEVQQQQSYVSAQTIRENIDKFKEASVDVQRSTLGEMIMPEVVKFCDEEFKSSAAKITGMLIDFTVFQVEDILDMLDNPSDLIERISEAQNLLKSVSG